MHADVKSICLYVDTCMQTLSTVRLYVDTCMQTLSTVPCWNLYFYINVIISQVTLPLIKVTGPRKRNEHFFSKHPNENLY